jgi:hypothetical protein
MKAKEKKSCGTCTHWLRKQDPPSCGWVQPALPFWAYIGNGDHEDYTEADQGQRCETYLKQE